MLSLRVVGIYKNASNVFSTCFT